MSKEFRRVVFGQCYFSWFAFDTHNLISLLFHKSGRMDDVRSLSRTDKVVEGWLEIEVYHLEGEQLARMNSSHPLNLRLERFHLEKVVDGRREGRDSNVTQRRRV